MLVSFVFINGNRQRVVDAPSKSVDSRPNDATREPGGIRPSSNGFGDLAIRQQAISACIATLFFVGRPATIARLIGAIVVYAVQGMLRGRIRSHIFKKCFKRINPALADSDSATSIARISGIVWVVASLLHSLPRVVLSAVRFTVCSSGLSNLLANTATALRTAVLEVRRFCIDDVPALAFALPKYPGSFSRLSSGASLACRKDSQASKYHAGKITSARHYSAPYVMPRLL
jgi:hypothetical protein